jgi:ATP-binding cassette subfamily B protein
VQSSQPLIGVENVKMPEWATVDQRVVAAGFKQAVRTLPAAIAVVVRLSWRTSPRLTVLAGIVHVVSGCVTAFGLLATANVFTSLLQDGPTPQRVVDSLSSIAVVMASYGVRALLDTAVAAVEGALRPQVVRAANDEVTASVVRVNLLAFEDADFQELARQGARYGVRSIETSLRWLADLVASIIALLASMLTAGLLNPWLAPVLLLAAVGDGWASARVAKLNYQHYLDTVGRNIRKSVVEEVATYRHLALERHALVLQEPLLGEYRRITESLMREESRLAHRSNLVRLTGRAAAGVGTAAAYVVLGALLYFGAMELALAGTAVLAMRTASNSLSNTMRAINSLYEDSFYIDFYNKLLRRSRRPKTLPKSGCKTCRSATRGRTTPHCGT